MARIAPVEGLRATTEPRRPARASQAACWTDALSRAGAPRCRGIRSALRLESRFEGARVHKGDEGGHVSEPEGGEHARADRAGRHVEGAAQPGERREGLHLRVEAVERAVPGDHLIAEHVEQGTSVVIGKISCCEGKDAVMNLLEKLR